MKRLGNNAVMCNEMQGAIEKTKSRISVQSLNLELDRETAWALCNLLDPSNIEKRSNAYLEDNQKPMLIKLGAAIGAFLDHPNRQFEHLTNHKE